MTVPLTGSEGIGVSTTATLVMLGLIIAVSLAHLEQRILARALPCLSRSQYQCTPSRTPLALALFLVHTISQSHSPSIVLVSALQPHTHALSHSLSLVLVVMLRSISRSILMLIF